MKFPTRRFAARSSIVLAAACLALVSACSPARVHNGAFPFSLMEKSPKPPKPKRGEYVASNRPAKMIPVLAHDTATGPPSRALLAALRPGDVVAFHLSHAEARQQIREVGVQKLPYELFRYGHIALVVPDPAEPRRSDRLKLLQVAMKQAVNAGKGLDYLDDQSWTVFRPPHGSVDPARLHEFSRRVVETAGDPKTAYDYSGALGFVNAPWQPDRLDEIGPEYSCATLVVAGLHYAGYELDAVHRGGKFDIVTPRQVVESHGTR